MLTELEPQDQTGNYDDPASDTKEPADKAGGEAQGNSARNRNVHAASVETPIRIRFTLSGGVMPVSLTRCGRSLYS